MEQNCRKIFLIILKFIPFLTALGYVLGTILNAMLIPIFPGWIWGTSLYTTLFIIAASYTFRFCFYHRIFIYYSFGIEFLNKIFFWLNLSLSVGLLIFLISLSFFIVCVIALINYLKHNEQVRIIKNSSTKHNK